MRLLHMALAVSILCVTSVPAWPQVVARNANIWDGRAHQPTRTQVRRSERMAGVRPSGAQVRRVNQELQRLGRELLRNGS